MNKRTTRTISSPNLVLLGENRIIDHRVQLAKGRHSKVDLVGERRRRYERLDLFGSSRGGRGRGRWRGRIGEQACAHPCSSPAAHIVQRVAHEEARGGWQPPPLARRVRNSRVRLVRMRALSREHGVKRVRRQAGRRTQRVHRPRVVARRNPHPHAQRAQRADQLHETRLQRGRALQLDGFDRGPCLLALLGRGQRLDAL